MRRLSPHAIPPARLWVLQTSRIDSRGVGGKRGVSGLAPCHSSVGLLDIFTVLRLQDEQDRWWASFLLR